MIGLKYGIVYLIHDGYFSEINKAYYKALKPYMHSSVSVRIDETVYYFKDPIEYGGVAISEHNLRNCVFFENELQFLQCTIYESRRINTKITDKYIIDKIEKSKNDYPELWI